MYDNHGKYITTYQTFTANDFLFPPITSSLQTRQLLLDLINRQANQNKQIILFIPTKAACARTVNDLIKYVDYFSPSAPGVLSTEIDDEILQDRMEVIAVF